MTMALNRGGNMADRRKDALAAAQRRRASGAAGKRHQQSHRMSVADAFRRDDTIEATRTYYAIVSVVAVMVLLGLVMLLSASGPLRAAGDGSPYSMVIRQATWAVVGLAFMSVVLRVRYEVWRQFVIPIGIFGVALMALPLVPGVGREVNDANSWVSIGPVGFQPSEIFKLAVIVGAADVLTRRQHLLNDWRRTIVPLGLMGGAAGIGSLVQGDFGSAVVLLSIVVVMAFIAGVPWMHLLSTLSALGGFGLLIIAATPRRTARLTAFLDIEGNKDHYAYQVWQGMLSIANGGLTGSGIGGSRSKLGYLPLAHSDFIFAVIADELGLFGVITVLGGFTLLTILGMQAALRAPDRFGMLLAAGVTAWLAIQAIINVGGVVGALPVTGLTLPFFSHGGTSLVACLVGVALLLNISRRGVKASGS